ncbi:MAG TPA: hypothetical protein VH251_12035, partial [Verrucomicrobiae bacterium]|nr:hypothetical protein [Verrucomicrobiae bacterium]
ASTMNWKAFSLLALCLFTEFLAQATAVWQWSVPVNAGRAFLWIPPDCRHVRAVIVGQNNMIEQGILERDSFREEMGRLGIAEIFIAPPFETWQNAGENDAANKKFDALLNSLADMSGYNEITVAPVIPIGHSELASYPWNFAAWNESRTLAIVSVHGDAPQTKLTGNGQTNANWGGRTVDGIPALMVMGEYEWLDDRLAPALKFRAAHAAAPIALLAEPGHGHFDYSDQLVNFLAMFIRKAVEYRLPEKTTPGQPPALEPVNPRDGWLVERWHLNESRTVKPAPALQYRGDPNDAFWAFDKEMALSTQDYFADQPGKSPQLVGFVQDGQLVPQTPTHQQINLKFEPEGDGVTFRLGTAFLDTVDGGSINTIRWTALPAGSALGHARKGGPIRLSCISGPVTQINTNTFRVQFDRINSTTNWQAPDIWLLAEHPGDAKYKSAVQQALMKLPTFDKGAEQHITFGTIPNQKRNGNDLKLHASSNSGRKVYFYVREGPAEMVGDTLRFTKIPPRAKFPVKVAVVAWQLGVVGKFKTAGPVTQEFVITE